MAKKKRQMAEYRYYKMPGNAVFFALQGERWRQKYEREIDFLHFHNFLEIGFCYSGSGKIPLHGKLTDLISGAQKIPLFMILRSGYMGKTENLWRSFRRKSVSAGLR